MENGQLNWIAGFIWNIADDVLRDVYVRGKFRNQIPTLVEADILGSLVEKFTSGDINLGPSPVFDQDGKVRLPGLDNHAMGTIFEELIRRFNEENNEEAGEHFTPRDVVRLMSNLIFYPIADAIRDATYRVYDGACGTGGMLTVAEETLQTLAREHGKEVSIHLFGQEVQPETYAISMADLLIKGEGRAAENMKYGSTLSSDAFPSMEFDFMLSNPPYGKSWKTDLERMGGKKDLGDPRFTVQHQGEEISLVTRSSDGQLMFLVNKLAKMIGEPKSPLGSRIAEVHNGSSLFTGDAGQGESNIRRWIIENDWLEAIIALPLNIFYNTGIATYIWVLTNRKPKRRKGKVQLIDATGIFTPLRKNLGKKNCELSAEQIRQITDVFLAFEETEQSKIFPNAAFGYWKITVERPLRLKVDLAAARRTDFRKVCEKSDDGPLAKVVDRIAESFGAGSHLNFDLFMEAVEKDSKKHDVKLTTKRLGLLKNLLAEKAENADPVVRKVHKPGKAKVDSIHGLSVGSAWTKMRIDGGRLSMPRPGEPIAIVFGPQSSQHDGQRRVVLLRNANHRAVDQRQLDPRHRPHAAHGQSQKLRRMLGRRPDAGCEFGPMSWRWLGAIFSSVFCRADFLSRRCRGRPTL